MTTYLLIDSLNNFMRCKHVVQADSPADKAALALHINFRSIRKVWNKFNADHLVFCLEGHSWRKEVYPKYKANRVFDDADQTPDDILVAEAFQKAYDDFIELVRDHTNASVLRHPLAEADDLIARWIATHPEDTHVIVSSDSDFVQLVAENVSLYNGIQDILITTQGVFDHRERPINFSVKNDGKLRISKKLLNDGDVPEACPDWIEYALFSKIMRGDKGDNIFTACKPGTRQYGSAKKAGIWECFEDRHEQGFDWFNFMNQRWTDHESKEHVVRDLVERNEMLIDLKKMPNFVAEDFDEYILKYQKQEASQLGFHFLRFVAQYGLDDIKKNPNEIVEMLDAKLPIKISTI